MKENRAVGPNLKTYFYYTNQMADESSAKGVIVIATGIEGTGALYDEIGDYLDSKGYALYAIDELGYGKTGKISKKIYKNWKKKDFHFASYNVHALSVLAKKAHPNCPVYLIGNDFGAMLSLYLIREFPEVIDKVVTIGWGTPRGQDYGFLFTSWLKKICLYDSGASKLSHLSKNKRFALRFEKGSKYSWLSSDPEQVKKIVDAGFIDTSGTVGHYYHYYSKKVKIPYLMRLKKCDRNTPMLFVSGSDDLLTKKGKTTKSLERYYKFKKFTNVSSLIVTGRHEILFEKNSLDNMQTILNWLENRETEFVDAINTNDNSYDDIEIVSNREEKKVESVSTTKETTIYNDNVVENELFFQDFQEAEEEDLLIRNDRESR